MIFGAVFGVDKILIRRSRICLLQVPNILQTINKASLTTTALLAKRAFEMRETIFYELSINAGIDWSLFEAMFDKVQQISF